MQYEIENPNFIYLAILAGLVFLAAVYGQFMVRRARKKFSAANQKLAIGWRLLGLIPGVVGLLLLTFALIDLRWGKITREVPQKGIEIVFALDVSRSMLAEDATPNRLARAKQQISDIVDNCLGDRVGLVIFAGEARQVVPLTNHYSDFKQTLESVDPSSLNRGGSRLGDALTTAANAFMDKTNEHKAIVLFTDGEDMESDPVNIAQQLATDRNIRVFTVGLGDIENGARIPDDSLAQSNNSRSQRGNSYLKYDGQFVQSKLNGSVLKQIATETGGAYIPAGTKRVNMGSVYRQFIASVQQTEFSTAEISVFEARFQWFALPALLLLLVEVFVVRR
jgi:Ca-activated chloride channel family protein